MAKLNIFGFKIGKDDTSEVVTSFAPPVLDDGAVTITAAGNYSLAIDLDKNNFKNEIELITRYRELAMQPEIELAIDDIINEAIVYDDKNPFPIDLNLESLKVSDKLKKAIEEEFKNILTLLNFKDLGADIFRRFYIDGRLNYHVLADEDNINKGIIELRYIDPRKLTKIREVQKSKDPTTGIELVHGIQEYYVFSDLVSTTASAQQTGLKISADSIISITSGLMDAKRSMVLSFIHKAIRPMNQLRMIEDASVIYKVSRAPERRIFYVDTGNLPKMKAEQYLRDLMTKYRNKVVYDASNGEIRDDRKYMSMQEDFWMPRRDGKSTEITTLPSSAAFDDMSMVEYFEKKLYKSLNVPYSRLSNPEQGFSIGRSQEISRDEIKFAKFVNRLRNRFSDIFNQALRIQCVFKGICTASEFEEYKQFFIFDWKKDNNYSELKEAELIGNRVNLLAQVDPYVGKYFTVDWIQHNVLNMTEDDIEQITKKKMEEISENLYPNPLLSVEVENANNQSTLQQLTNPPEMPGNSSEGMPNEPVEGNSPGDKLNKTLPTDSFDLEPDNSQSNTNPYYNG